MADTTKHDAKSDIVPGYGEADSEAASMNSAAKKDETRDQADPSDLKRDATEAAAKIPPAEAGPVGDGSSETDVKRRIAETARRKADEAARASD